MAQPQPWPRPQPQPLTRHFIKGVVRERYPYADNAVQACILNHHLKVPATHHPPPCRHAMKGQLNESGMHSSTQAEATHECAAEISDPAHMPPPT